MEWISVKDRLPNNEDTEYNLSKTVTLCDGEYFDFGHYDYNKNIFKTYGKFMSGINVTHWASVPKHPKE